MDTLEGLRPLIYKLLFSFVHKKIFNTVILVGGFQGYFFTQVFDLLFDRFIFPFLRFLEIKAIIKVDKIKVIASVKALEEAQTESEIVDAFNNLA